MAFQHVVTKGLPLSEENFESPPMEMGIIPFWFWNGDMEEEEMEWQLREYHAAGVRSLFIHGRMGLGVGYLSDTWFDRVRFAVDKAKEIGIDAWVYDEMDWPSGTAGKQVLEQAPEFAQRYLELVPLQIKGPLFTFLEAHDDRYVATGDSNPIAAYGARVEEWNTEISEVVDLNKNLSWEKTIPWEAPEGDWVLLYFLEKKAPYYIDTLDPGSTEKFLELTHDKYKEVVGDEFGKTVPGFFTDEPAMYYYHVGLNNYVIPWSRQMFKIFRSRRGYDLRRHLPALYASMGPQTAKIRYDFWRTLTEQYTETYYKRIRDWCDDNGVLFTGHLLFEEWLRLGARCEGNIFKYLEQMHLIGVDHLYPKIGSPDEPAEHVALKVGSSAAHHFGSTRLLCESMGGTYWNCTLERMKWMNNWEYVLGVNLFNNHGYHYTIEGERKRDWPPSQFYHHTWWKYYDRFTEYNARLSHILSGGRHVAKVLILYPINSIWTNFTPQKRDNLSAVIEDEFNFFTDALLRLHFDFDYVDEDVLAGARIEDGKIHIADEEYELLILPPITHIKTGTMDRLSEFVDAGGQVIAGGLIPEGLLNDDGADISEVDFFGIDAESLRAEVVADSWGERSVTNHGTGGRVRLIRGTPPHRQKDLATMDRVVRDCITPDVQVSREEVFYLHRRKSGRDVYYFVNTDQRDLGPVTISLEQVARPELWDPNTGKSGPLQVFRVRDGRLEFELDFPSAEAHLVVLSSPLPETYVEKANFAVTEVGAARVVGFGCTDPVAEVKVRRPGGVEVISAPAQIGLPPIHFPAEMAFRHEWPNALLLEDWKMRVAPEVGARVDWYRDEFDAQDWLEVTQGAWEMQLPHERDEAEYPVEVWYRSAFDAEVVPDDLRVLIDGFSGSEQALFINGKELDTRGERAWLDAEIREVSIASATRLGTNHVAIKLVVTRRTDGLLDPLKIVGSFGILGAGAEARIGPPPASMSVGDWTKQGLPQFSGTGVYTTSIMVPAAYLEGGRVWLEADPGEDVLEVSVNGKGGLVLPWHPYRVDVTEYLDAGANVFQFMVTNTLLNLLEGKSQESGLRRPPVLRYEPRQSLSLS